MTTHPFGPIVPVAIIALLPVACSGWAVWRVKFAYRSRGRREIGRMLASRGETLVATKDVPFSSPLPRTGLSTNVIFEIRARTSDGEERTYHWAYEAGVFPWESEGLKRLAHGIWIPA